MFKKRKSKFTPNNFTTALYHYLVLKQSGY